MMNKRICRMVLAVLLMLLSTSALAWETPCFDGAANWQYEDDARSIHIQKVSENNATWFVADIQLASVEGFHADTSGDFAPVSELAKRTSAVLAVNGDDYGTHKYGVIIRNGELLRTHDTTRNLLVIDANGDMSVKIDRKNEDYRALGTQLVEHQAWQSYEFGPELVRDGQAVAFSTAFDVISTKPSRLEPRTAIGQVGPLHYIVIVVDGRQDGYSAGMSLQDLQQLFVRYGAQTAMNLDGGGSAEMWFQGMIISSPSGGEERYVSDIIWF